jgi:cytidylate kinase
VAIELADVPAGKALREMARKAGISLVFDPRIGKSVNQTISLQVDEATVETGLRLIAELVDLKAVRMGNIVFVTDPVRADRIRKEEAIVIETTTSPTSAQIIGHRVSPPAGALGSPTATPSKR